MAAIKHAALCPRTSAGRNVTLTRSQLFAEKTNFSALVSRRFLRVSGPLLLPIHRAPRRPRDHRRRRDDRDETDDEQRVILRSARRRHTGGQCREASRFVEQALGRKATETLTAEFYQEQPADQALKQSQ